MKKSFKKDECVMGSLTNLPSYGYTDVSVILLQTDFFAIFEDFVKSQRKSVLVM